MYTVLSHVDWKPGEREWIGEHVGTHGVDWYFGPVTAGGIQALVFASEEKAVLYTLRWM